MGSFTEANYPWYMQNDDKTIDIPINSMDCIRIFHKLQELKEDPDAVSSLWSPLQLAQFFLDNMTAVMDNKPT